MSASKGNAFDPKGLILESFRIDGITKADCRTIFLDWALSLPEGQDAPTALEAVILLYAADHPDHPMTAVLEEGRAQAATPRRRGGWRSRPRPSQS